MERDRNQGHRGDARHAQPEGCQPERPQERTQYELLPKQGVRHEPGLNRNFRINNRVLEKYGPTMGCKGCENKMTGDDARPHSSECRARLEELMRGDDVEAEIIARRDD